MQNRLEANEKALLPRDLLSSIIIPLEISLPKSCIVGVGLRWLLVDVW